MCMIMHNNGSVVLQLMDTVSDVRTAITSTLLSLLLVGWRGWVWPFELTLGRTERYQNAVLDNDYQTRARAKFVFGELVGTGLAIRVDTRSNQKVPKVRH